MKSQWIQYGLEEMKFISSLEEMKQFYIYKWPFLKSRLTRNFIRMSEAPLSLQIEPTNYCNLNCICCSGDISVRKKGFMNLELFKRIIDDAAESGVKRVYLYLHGEPTLHPDIMKMIKYIKGEKLAITMATNGMLMTKTKTEEILDSGMNSLDYLVFSILGYSKGVHESIMKGVNHEKVEENLLTLMALKQKKGKGPIVETVFYNMPENEHEEEQFVHRWRGVADHARAIGRTARQFAQYKTGDDDRPARDKTCKNLWERMTVFWNGDVTRCIADLDGDHVYGNLGRQSIKDVWNSENLLAVKRIHRENNSLAGLEMCSTCDW